MWWQYGSGNTLPELMAPLECSECELDWVAVGGLGEVESALCCSPRGPEEFGAAETAMAGNAETVGEDGCEAVL